jgi:hypothetical protein
MRERGADSYVRDALAAAEQRGDPRLALALEKLAGVASIGFAPGIGTAHIRLSNGRYRIELDPVFAKRELASGEDALFVLLHELSHKVRGDLVRFDGTRKRPPLARAATNIVADIAVNSALCEHFFPEGAAILERLYGTRSFPAILLLPPHQLVSLFGEEHGFPRTFAAATLDAVRKIPRRTAASLVSRVFATSGLDAGRAHDLADWYLSAWLDAPVFERALDTLLLLLDGTVEEEILLLLLGDHEGEPGEGELDDLGSELEESLRAGEGGETGEEEIDPVLPSRHATALQEAIRHALEPDPSDLRAATGFAPVRALVPSVGRRETFLLASHVWPVFFKTRFAGQPTDDTERAHVYVDVSGSTSTVQPFLYGLVIHAQELVAEPLYLFSTEVVPVSLAELLSGRVVTTRGTDFDCVIQHAAREGFRKILLVTDGNAEFCEESREIAVRDALEIYVVLTESNPACPLLELARASWVLDRP